MEINSKNLHKHAVPLLIIAAVALVTSVIALNQYQPEISNGLEALFGHKADQENPMLPNIGDGAKVQLETN